MCIVFGRMPVHVQLPRDPGARRVASTDAVDRDFDRSDFGWLWRGVGTGSRGACDRCAGLERIVSECRWYSIHIPKGAPNDVAG